MYKNRGNGSTCCASVDKRENGYEGLVGACISYNHCRMDNLKTKENIVETVIDHVSAMSEPLLDNNTGQTNLDRPLALAKVIIASPMPKARAVVKATLELWETENEARVMITGHCKKGSKNEEALLGLMDKVATECEKIISYFSEPEPVDYENENPDYDWQAYQDIRKQNLLGA